MTYGLRYEKAVSKGSCEEQGNKWLDGVCEKVSAKDWCEDRGHLELVACAKNELLPEYKYRQIQEEIPDVDKHNPRVQYVLPSSVRSNFDFDNAVVTVEVPSTLVDEFLSKLSKLKDAGANITVEELPERLYEVEERVYRDFYTGVLVSEDRYMDTTSEVMQEKPVEVRTKVVDVNKENWDQRFKDDKAIRIKISGSMLQKFGENITIPKSARGDLLIGLGHKGDPILSKIYDPNIVLDDRDRKLINEGGCEGCCVNRPRELLYLVQYPDGSRHTYGSTCGVNLFGGELGSLFSKYRKQVEKEAEVLQDEVDNMVRSSKSKVFDDEIHYESAAIFLGLDPQDYWQKKTGKRDLKDYYPWDIHTKTFLKPEDYQKLEEKLEEATEIFEELRSEHPESGYYDNTYAVLRDSKSRLSGKWAESVVNTINKLKGIEVQRSMEAPDRTIDVEPGKMTNFTDFKIVYIKVAPPADAYSSDPYPAHKIIVKRADGQKGMFRWDVTKKMPFEVGDTINFRAKLKSQGEGISFLTHAKDITQKDSI